MILKPVLERVIYALADAAVGYKIRSAHYRHLAEISAVVASRDLQSSVKIGMLKASGEKRGRVYEATNSIREIAIKIRNSEPGQIADPFTRSELITG